MDTSVKQLIWNQFGASIDALKNAITNCPENIWGDKSNYHQYWYVAYHTLFWLDLYLDGSSEGFMPPEPFKLEELDPAGVLPERVYMKDELLAYLEHGRNKGKEIILNLTDEQAEKQCQVGRVSLPYGELLLYIMRHIQHHTGQLNLLLRLKADIGSKWVFQAE